MAQPQKSSVPEAIKRGGINIWRAARILAARAPSVAIKRPRGFAFKLRTRVSHKLYLAARWFASNACKTLLIEHARGARARYNAPAALSPIKSAHLFVLGQRRPAARKREKTNGTSERVNKWENLLGPNKFCGENQSTAARPVQRERMTRRK